MTSFYPYDQLSARGRTLEAVGLDAQMPQVRRAQDGHIDMDYYLARGRDERSKAARAFFGGIGRLLGRVYQALILGGQKAARVNRTGPHYV